MARWFVFWLTAVAVSFIVWLGIASMWNEQGDGELSLAAVIMLQNCAIIVMLAAVLARLNGR
ncbi:hypothetical protein [Geobacillus sp. TFV-3]|uniref:hypothetical protein n=1 Tax=Geobacillus sp. TFV-3 TaxID=1897059 RepID=UPI001F37494A|nr:hypothetical protein [Geobacillus sp. TFV-3]KAF0996319.1 hypothetical protein BJQ97_03007 [Geobacillus sp. TFV-3]